MTLDQISAELYEKNCELIESSHYKMVRMFMKIFFLNNKKINFLI